MATVFIYSYKLDFINISNVYIVLHDTIIYNKYSESNKLNNWRV